MDSSIEDDVLNNFGLRIRLHDLSCHKHAAVKNFLPEFLIRDDKNIEYIKETADEIYELLQYSTYINYASIIITISSICTCRSSILEKCLKIIKNNRYLRYKTKLVIVRYPCLFHVPIRPRRYTHYDKVLINTCLDSKAIIPKPKFIIFGTRKCTKYTKCRFAVYYPSCLHSNCGRVQKCPTLDIDGCGVFPEMQIFRDSRVDNIFLMQEFIKGSFYRPTVDICYIFQIIRERSTISLNKFFITTRNCDAITHEHTNACLYFYNINPALAIIINNYYFTKHHTIRKGSEQDVRRLIEELTIAQIPFIIIQDGNRQELLQTMDYIKMKDFHPLKSLLFFLMSHGEANDIIFTDDGELNLVDDIVKPIQSNKSLKHASKVIVVTSCRGTIDMQYADYDDLELIKPTRNAEYLSDNTVIWRSVPELVASPRDETMGTPFMISFCKDFRFIDPKQDISELYQRIEQDLKKEPYYADLEVCSDLIVSNKSGSHRIIRPRIEALQMIKLIESLRKEFLELRRSCLIKNGGVPKKANSHFEALFYICGFLKAYQQMPFEEIYFSLDIKGK